MSSFLQRVLISYCGKGVDLKVDDLSLLYISGSTSVVRFLCYVFFLGFIKNIKALVFT